MPRIRFCDVDYIGMTGLVRDNDVIAAYETWESTASIWNWNKTVGHVGSPGSPAYEVRILEVVATATELDALKQIVHEVKESA